MTGFKFALSFLSMHHLSPDPVLALQRPQNLLCGRSSGVCVTLTWLLLCLSLILISRMRQTSETTTKKARKMPMSKYSVGCCGNRHEGMKTSATLGQRWSCSLAASQTHTSSFFLANLKCLLWARLKKIQSNFPGWPHVDLSWQKMKHLIWEEQKGHAPFSGLTQTPEADPAGFSASTFLKSGIKERSYLC